MTVFAVMCGSEPQQLSDSCRTAAMALTPSPPQQTFLVLKILLHSTTTNHNCPQKTCRQSGLSQLDRVRFFSAVKGSKFISWKCEYYIPISLQVYTILSPRAVGSTSCHGDSRITTKSTTMSKRGKHVSFPLKQTRHYKHFLSASKLQVHVADLQGPGIGSTYCTENWPYFVCSECHQ